MALRGLMVFMYLLQQGTLSHQPPRLIVDPPQADQTSLIPRCSVLDGWINHCYAIYLVLKTVKMSVPILCFVS